MIAFTARLFSSFQVFFGLEPEGRRLTETEIAVLATVFAGAVDFSQVLVKEGRIGVFGASQRALTLCNTIYIPGEDGAGWGAPGSPGYLQLLVHEMVHVWQFQHGGTDYITASLKEQARGLWSGKGVNEAYDYARGIRDGKSWAEFNPEQQAKLIEDAYAFHLFTNPDARLAKSAEEDHTDYAKAAIQKLLAGEGAP
jgi:hypothetical protein